MSRRTREQPRPRSETDPDDCENPEEQPLMDESVRCPGCETTRQWASFTVPPEDVDAIATCPNCGTHIIGFDSVSADDREELSSFLRSVTGCFEDSDGDGDVDGDMPALTEISAVSARTAVTLSTVGFETVADVAAGDETALTGIEGIGETQAEAIVESANALLDDQSDRAMTDSTGDE